MKDLTIYVLTHNRGELLLETVESVLNQNCSDFKFIVSDNSSNNNAYELLKENKLLDKVDYIKRDKEYSSLDHFNMCLSEVKTTYFMLFHDDDIMMSNMVEELYNSIKDTNHVAIASNGYFLSDNVKSKKKFYNFKMQKRVINTSELAEYYCLGKIAPYPSYMYNKCILKDKIFNDNVGKYSDVTWLLNITENNSILWLNRPLMYYRLHSGQDSSSNDYKNQLKLIKILEKNCLNRKVLLKYRINNLYFFETKNRRKVRNIYIYMKYSFYYLFPRVLIKRIFKIVR